jgi:hypothetical protein
MATAVYNFASWLGGAIQGYGIRAINTIAQIVPDVHLRLSFLSPEPGTEIRPFPATFPIIVRYGLELPVPQQTERNYQVQADGYLTFPAWDAIQSTTFSLRYQCPAGNVPYIACEARGAAVSQRYDILPNAHHPHEDVAALFGGPGRLFSLPPVWLLHQLDWHSRGAAPLANAPDVGPNAAYTVATGRIERLVRADIGSPAAPIEFVLDPHWTFWRFLHFDRYYGHTHNRQVSIPPIWMEGFRANGDADADPADCCSNWTVGADADQLQSLPWALRRVAGGAALPNMTGATAGLRFRTHRARRTMVFSQDQNTRLLRDMDPAQPADRDALKPSPDRLHYYDLPRIWKSRRYLARHVAGEQPPVATFFQDLTAADIQGTENRGTPLLFALDDMVLYESAAAAPTNPLPALAATERVAIFNHRFDNTLANSTEHGVYKVVAAPPDPFYTPGSNAPPTAENYLHDYPDWTRLVVALGNLFDVFDQRTPDHAGATRVVGARAAVQWLDGTRNIPNVYLESPPGTWIADPTGRAVPLTQVPAPAPTLKVPDPDPFFAIQAFFSQRTSVRYSSPFNSSRDELVGRFDQALLRCCDVQGPDEVAVNLHYIKSFFDFTAPSSPPLPPNLTNAGGQGQYAYDISNNVALRWNGNDAANGDRVQLLPRVLSPPGPPLPPLKTFVVWFPQSVARDRAHFKVDVISIDRPNRGGVTGIGQSGPAHSAEEDANTHWFSSAHESGHMDALPDEYNERWWGVSYNQLSFKQNLPGDPYEPDGRTEGGAALSPPITPLMNGNVTLRNRYFWHAAEWVRPIINAPLKVKHGAYDDFFLPEYSGNDSRSYYPWPLISNNLTMNNITSDFYLYAMGKERYSETLIANAPVDGLLVIVLRMICHLPADPAIGTEVANREDLLMRMAAITRQYMNDRFYATGQATWDSPPKTRQFNRCALQFVPQYLVENHPHSSPPRGPNSSDVIDNIAIQRYADNIKTTLPPHVRVVVTASPPASPPTWRWIPASPPNLAQLEMDVRTPNDVEWELYRALPWFWDLYSPPNGIVAASWQRWVGAIMPGATVRRIP